MSNRGGARAQGFQLATRQSKKDLAADKYESYLDAIDIEELEDPTEMVARQTAGSVDLLAALVIPTVYMVLVAVLLAGIHINLADNDTKPASVYLNRTVTEHV